MKVLFDIARPPVAIHSQETKAGASTEEEVRELFGQAVTEMPE
jgi:hypothetical protein